MKHQRKIAFLFPGQGAQYVGMGKDFANAYAIAKQTFQEADDLLQCNLTKIAFEGPEDTLTETRNSQTAIFVNSIAILRTVNSLFPTLTPYVCAGHSVGEYSALTASGVLPFQHSLPLVRYRGHYMNDACEEHRGTMAVVMGLSTEEVEATVRDLKLSDDLWVALLNCPGQVVISGTLRGIEAGTQALKERGAKRVLPLQVYGAFHSGLMRSAAEKLALHIEQSPFQAGSARLVMNVPGDFVEPLALIRHNLVQAITVPVRWEQGVRAIQREAIDLYIEIGCGKTLTGMNKRIGVTVPTISIEKLEDLRQLEEQVGALAL